ncbi:MAG: DNA-protecting protein DprA [Burkholderiales bacterium]|nr:DNA-protecting protein DprA [Burkholderiales bacterium]
MPAHPADIESWLNLTLIPGLGGAGIRKLLQRFGSPDQVLAASVRSLSEIVPATAAQKITAGAAPESIDATLAWLQDATNHIVTVGDERYPKLLLQTADPPLLLYVKGALELLNQPMLAVVGSRNATPQGLHNASSFAHALSDVGLCVISGLALGIDAAAHRGGLIGASASVAVVGTGLDIVYPARNRQLAHEIAQRGALVSEFPIGTPALGNNFPRRNRVISGMSLGCLVVEAATQSGSLITARVALEQGREVFAIPGSIHSPHSKGCHWLIKQGAKLVECADDILQELNWRGRSTLPSTPTLPPSLGAEAETVLRHMGFDPCTIDTLCRRSGIGAETLSAILLTLELDGLVSSFPGGLYQRISGSAVNSR